MSDTITVTLTKDERDELVRSLVLHQNSNPEILLLFKQLRQLLTKLAQAEEGPKITIGVFGGSVQWIFGNPFPIRICDYDGEEPELPDADEHQQPCRIWFHHGDENWAKNTWRCYP